MAVSACYPPAPVYRVQRAARVPHAAVPLRTGQPLAGPVELTVGASNLDDVIAPERGDAATGVEVARRQVRGELRFRIGRHGEAALVHERGVGPPAHRLDDGTAPIGDGDPHGTGGALRYAILDDTRKFALGIDVEVLQWSLPYVEYRTCVENCVGSSGTTIDRGTVHETTVGFGLTPTYRHRRWVVFGGAFVRNHPTVVRKGTEYSTMNSEDVEGGPTNVLLHAGFAYQLLDGISVLLLGHQNVTTDPVRYGPGLAVALSASLSSR
jgi:hypothetical protein